MKYGFVALVVAALTVPAFGQDGADQREIPGQGDWELSVGGSGSNDNDFDNGSFELTGDVGKYVTPELLLALRQSVSYTNLSGSGDLWQGNTRVAADYHFDLGNLRPFVGGNFGYVYGDNVDETFAAGPEGGVKYYMQDNAFLFARVEYQFFFDSGSDIDEGFEDGNFIYTVGAGLNF